MWLYYIEGTPPVPVGFYGRPSDVIGIKSVKLPDGVVTRTLRSTTRFLKQVDDLVPGLRDFLEIVL